MTNHSFPPATQEVLNNVSEYMSKNPTLGVVTSRMYTTGEYRTALNGTDPSDPLLRGSIRINKAVSTWNRREAGRVVTCEAMGIIPVVDTISRNHQETYMETSRVPRSSLLGLRTPYTEVTTPAQRTVTTTHETPRHVPAFKRRGETEANAIAYVMTSDSNIVRDADDDRYNALGAGTSRLDMTTLLPADIASALWEVAVPDPAVMRYVALDALGQAVAARRKRGFGDFHTAPRYERLSDAWRIGVNDLRNNKGPRLVAVGNKLVVPLNAAEQIVDFRPTK